MTIYGKIENGRLVIAGNIIKGIGWSIANPTATQLKDKGYKLVVYGDKPESYDDEEQKITETYKETAKQIKVTYELTDLTDEEHNAVIDKKIMEKELETTSRYIRNAPLGDEYAIAKLKEIETAIADLRKKYKTIKGE